MLQTASLAGWGIGSVGAISTSPACWQHEGCISHKTTEQARTHYGGYSIKTDYEFRIISFNTGELLFNWARGLVS